MINFIAFLFKRKMSDTVDLEIPELYRKVPKVELHAHLNGSISQNTLLKLVHLKRDKSGDVIEGNCEVFNMASSDLSGCFNLFNHIHSLINFPEAVYMATCDVIEEFHNDGVKYLELRTTPKNLGEYMTQDIYVETVLEAIRKMHIQTSEGISVKLLLSLDRKRSFNDAEETIRIAKRCHTSSSDVVGIDLSGDPRGNDILPFMPLLEDAKKSGLKIAVHISEVPNSHMEEMHLLKLQPDRIGHGTYLHPSRGGCNKNFALLNELRIPLEICLTSNVVSKTVSSYEMHHFPLFKKMGYPCILCTDDKGVFNITLSKEYYLASKYYSLAESELFDMSFESIEYTFCTEFEKRRLKDLWKQWRSES